MTELQQLSTCVTAHAWNKDKSLLAFCPDNNEVHIYKKAGTGYALETILTEHDQVVTGIDWAPNSNRIVTCSQDRNAYVWKFEGGKWQPTLVILRINRAATAVKWSPNETKFAVASGAKTVSICYFESENDWWISKHVKKHKSTVLSVAWHPNSIFLATGSSDFKTRIFSAFVKGVDKRPDDASNPWGAKTGTFGNLLSEFSAGGWVHSVSWSPSGTVLAYVAHDSTISVVEVASGNSQTLSLTYLPFRTVEYVGDDQIVAAGHDCNPMLFAGGVGSLKFVKKLDEAVASKAGPQGSAASATRQLWADKVDKGADSVSTTLATKHQNAISSIGIFAAAGSKVSQFTTSGVDGKLVLWKL
eukprot:TRINITY_DN3443_c0_g1_i1.p1 TRINITY_DN3443_c0_g1~~TRINITY_DN3443_c0_g1_i1.p1  ORF type:complete len:359 (+),score=104.50 TRINITY_DN3443_c0_g1_i1:82-1158(+)